MKKTKDIYVIRQTQYLSDCVDYAFVAYEDYEQAKKECDKLNKKYYNKGEHFYEVDNIILYKKERKLSDEK